MPLRDFSYAIDRVFESPRERHQAEAKKLLPSKSPHCIGAFCSLSRERSLYQNARFRFTINRICPKSKSQIRRENVCSFSPPERSG